MFNNYTWIATRDDGSVYFAEIDVQTDRFMVQATFSDMGSCPGGQVIVSLADPEDRGEFIWSNQGVPIAAVDLPACMSARRLRRAIRQAIREARYLLGTDYRYGVFDLRHYAGAEAEWKTAA